MDRKRIGRYRSRQDSFSNLDSICIHRRTLKKAIINDFQQRISNEFLSPLSKRRATAVPN